MLTPALGLLAATLSMSLPWPQVWRSCAQRRTTGLSATAVWLGVGMPVGWITYGLLMGDRLQVVSNVVNGLAGLAVLGSVLLTRLDLRTRRRLLTTAAAAGTVTTAAAITGLAAALPGVSGRQVAPLLGVVLALAATLSAIPQPLALLRDRTQDLSGLSPLRWRLGLAACSCWFLYGLSLGEAAVWASALAGLISAGIVCAVVAARRPAPSPDAIVISARWRESVITRGVAVVGV
jgi:uncharacterized protein with PQ loop repeat